jgi:flagellin
MLTLRHKEFGSDHSFQVASNTAGLVSAVADVSQKVKNGLDVAGEIAGEEANGKGQVLTGAGGFGSKTEGVSIRYDGLTAPPPGQQAGTLTFTQKSLKFQVGGNSNQVAKVSLKSVKAHNLGNGVANDSGFRSLASVSFLTSKGARDSIGIIDKAIKEVAASRGFMGAFQRNDLESNLNYLRTAHESVINSESVIRDADMAEEMTKVTRDKIMLESNTAMLAQANQSTMSILKLLG